MGLSKGGHVDIAMSQSVRTGAQRSGTSLKRVLVLAAALLIAVSGLTFTPLGSSASAAEAIAQCNSIENTPGRGIICDVTVINNLDATTGVASSTVTLKACLGPANTAETDPAMICTSTTTSYGSLVTSVNQCNSAANGGGGSVICNVYVTNNITGAPTTGVTPATINQCVGSGSEGSEPTLKCSPVPASTTNATITQCNGSANGGGAPERVTCTVSPSTVSSQIPVLINQCNDSANGGGAVVTCTTSLTNDSRASTPIAKNVLNDSRTDGFTHTAGRDGFSDSLGILVLLLAGLLTAAFAARRMGAHR